MMSDASHFSTTAYFNDGFITKKRQKCVKRPTFSEKTCYSITVIGQQTQHHQTERVDNPPGEYEAICET
jgi:hypothetical protein